MPNLYLVKLPLPYHAEALKHNGISDLTKSTVRVCPLPLGVVVFEGAMVDVVGRCLCGFNRCHFYASTYCTFTLDIVIGQLRTDRIVPLVHRTIVSTYCYLKELEILGVKTSNNQKTNTYNNEGWNAWRCNTYNGP